MTVSPGDPAKTAVRIGHNIAAHRQRKGPDGMTQDALAAEMRAIGHLTWRQSTVHKVETAQRDLTAVELQGLAYIFEIPEGRLTWAQGEEAAVMMAEHSISILRQAAEEAATAVARLHAARAGSARAREDSLKSPYQRARELADEIEVERQDATLKNVLAEAWGRWEHFRDGGD
jgi:hypothetical protein